MKKLLIMLVGLMLASGSEAQHIHGSIKRGTLVTSVDILFRPTYNSAGGEYINYVQFSLAIPLALSTGVNAYLTGVGNFATLSFVQAAQYTQGTERIYTWVCNNPGATTMTWFANTEFTGATVTFNGNPSASALVRMLDLTNSGGGGNSNTYFAIISSTGDVTDYSAFFYDIPGPNGSSLGTYGNGDQFVQTLLSIILPTDQLTFSGYKDGNRNQLLWTTETEQNNRGFEVQRSPDGVNYFPIGFVSTMANGGNSQVLLNYTFTDNNPTGSRQYYRLRQVDFSGGSKISNVVLIKGDKPITINRLYPNPATTTINLLAETPIRDKVSVVMTDLTGRTVIQRAFNVEAGNITLRVDVSSLAGGTYVVKMISSNGEVITGKFIKN